MDKNNVTSDFAFTFGFGKVFGSTIPMSLFLRA
jgi:hypothetical protein